MEKNELISLINQKVSLYHNDTVSYYKFLHRHPELSFEEKNTSEYVEQHLNQWGIEHRSRIGGYGILACIKGRNPESRTIALRADMDALPITEQNNIDFKSQNEGIMHACGHDTHTASLLGVARIINELREHFEGTILFIFQPGEEKHPGGASLMLKDGIFDTYKPDLIIGQHAYVDYAVGTVGFESGVVMASADEVHIRIKGKGGHGAIPHEVNDTVLAASQVIVSMQQIVSRRSNPFKPCVLSFGKFIADGATNVIPDTVTLAGSLRCMDEEERSKLRPIIRDIAIHTASAYGCECEIDVYDGYPCTYNDETVTIQAKSFATEYLGKEKVLGLPKRMTSEDFGFFSQQYPSTFYRYGIKGDQLCTGLHTSTFLIDEDALRTSVGTMAYLAMRYCI
ncbi:M20 metallopeptidase family protein [Dysgonomonas macrotermitis]|uniref:Hippurate hydrolase n=1 Tax=Dysgonomonas macrotermitis TaxID=1346286 RepID=A0A1M4SQX2_9BACT|nr:M20 family metallopeptidase [Dysgonomonas macrotermitis]SHE34610.1 hippurate hydrolase [Dysgonomonas macrotermitis]